VGGRGREGGGRGVGGLGYLIVRITQPALPVINLFSLWTASALADAFDQIQFDVRFVSARLYPRSWKLCSPQTRLHGHEGGDVGWGHNADPARRKKEAIRAFQIVLADE
jgi:hypothetical protein